MRVYNKILERRNFIMEISLILKATLKFQYTINISSQYTLAAYNLFKSQWQFALNLVEIQNVERFQEYFHFISVCFEK